MYATMTFETLQYRSLAFAVEVHGQPVTVERFTHVESLGMPNMRLEPHFSGGRPFASLVLAKQVRTTPSVFATRSFVEFAWWLYDGRMTDAPWQSLTQVAHGAAAHVAWQELEERLVLVIFGQEAFFAQQIKLTFASGHILYNVDLDCELIYILVRIHDLF